jgi:hypothetical protein
MATRVRCGGTVVTNDFWKELVSKSDEIAQGQKGSGRISIARHKRSAKYCQAFFFRASSAREDLGAAASAEQRRPSDRDPGRRPPAAILSAMAR